MAIEQRPYAGTWKSGGRATVAHTPDALVFINGDLSVAGCPSCRGRIDIQQFITQVSVEAGTDPGAHSASISLTTPAIAGEPLFVEGRSKLHPGLEVHIFLRGYFPVQGGLSSLVGEQTNPLTEESTIDPQNVPTYPYYPAFHGVVTQVSYDYSDGEYHAGLQCASLLHFWQYHSMSTNGSHFGSRPDNSSIRPTLYGNVFNNMNPYGIIYTLYRDVAGAPGGVAYALDEQSNLSAPSVDRGKSLFSQVLLYWEQRFKTRIQNLRMYGVNGQLFNAAQQAYFGTASNRDLQKLVENSQFRDPETLKTARDPWSQNFSVEKALGLAGGGLDVTFSPQISENGTVTQLNLLDMTAYTQSIQDLNVNLWETTYETKLDIANQVTEVTGFEFYQDVDGDLVFKPPFYNLDTSPSRAYRIEARDIISISFQEGEPQATWIMVKGTWFKGLNGVVATDGVTNKRAVYVDFKLVAQFGWRPANMEVTYTVDSRALFFIGMARLDTLNVGVYSANLTIPIRPEMRPGFPVYIAPYDCFYYVTALSHSFSFGGQCTTSLTLSARRTKFFAPGLLEPVPQGGKVTDLIRLDRPDLPQRPVEVYEGAVPRLAGFPNVVMALDPSKANPKFFVVGVGLEHLQTDTDVKLLLDYIRQDLASISPAVFQIVPQADGVSSEETVYQIQTGPNPEDAIQFSLQDLQGAFKDLQQVRNELASLKKQLERKQGALLAQIQASNVGLGGGGGDLSSLRQDIASLSQKVAEVSSKLDLTGGSSAQDTNKLLVVIQAYNLHRGSPDRRTLNGVADADVTAAYFDALMAMKSQYADQLPGYRRYYSASHPDPDQQGQGVMIFTDGRRVPNQEDTPIVSSPTPVPAPTIPLGAESQDQFAKLDSMLAALGVTDFTAAELAPEISGGQRRRAKDFQPPDGVVENLASLGAVLQELRNRSGLAIQVVNAWRPFDEVEGLGPTAELGSNSKEGFDVAFSKVSRGSKGSRHITGEAADVQISPKTQENIQKFEDAIAALCAEGKIRGFGIYAVPGRGYAHIDIRKFGPGPQTYSGNKDGSKDYTPNNVAQGILDAYTEANGLPSIGLGGQRVPAAPRAKVPTGPGQPKPPQESPQPVAKVAEAPSNSSVQVDPVLLPRPRRVEGFVPPTVVDGTLRPPEADIGIVQATRGLLIAQGPGQEAKILATDEIQTVCFSQFLALKNFEAAGNSKFSGKNKLSEAALRTRLGQRLSIAANGETITPSSSPEDLFGGFAAVLSEEISQIEIPIYQSGVLRETRSLILGTLETVLGERATQPLTSQSSTPGNSSRLVETKARKGKTFGDSIAKLSEEIAAAWSTQVFAAFGALLQAASSPKTGSVPRVAALTEAFDQIGQLLWGGVFQATDKGLRLIKTGKSAVATRRIHSPVIPVSDSRGYEVFGAYRYGRGLTVDTGGSFERIHNGSLDPFAGASAKTAEEFLRALTLVTGPSMKGGNSAAILEARQAELAAKIEELELSTVNASEGLPPEEAALLAAKTKSEAKARAALRLALAELSRTPTGTQALGELTGQGEDVLKAGIGRTQFEEKFINFAANYARTDVMKTTVNNVANSLTDLSAHLTDSLYSLCQCRAAQASVLLESVTRSQYVSPAQGTGPVFEAASEAMESLVPPYLEGLKQMSDPG